MEPTFIVGGSGPKLFCGNFSLKLLSDCNQQVLREEEQRSSALRRVMGAKRHQEALTVNRSLPINILLRVE